VAWMRKVESRIERGFSRVFSRSPKMGLQAGELALKMMREMDGRTRTVHGRVYVPNFFAVYLCSADRSRFRPTEQALTRQLEGQLTEHARSSGYNLMSAPEVGLFTDADLRLGQFGLRAEVRDPVSGRVLDSSVPVRVPDTASAPVSSRDESPSVRSEPESPPVPARLALVPAIREDAPAEVTAPPCVVLRQNGRAKEFRKERVVLGRARDADFRVNDPNVSRRHAMLFWQSGRIFVRDLGSTNGTLVNGRPASSVPLDSGDVITLGGAHVLVETP
jgi:hypothetical protein